MWVYKYSMITTGCLFVFWLMQWVIDRYALTKHQIVFIIITVCLSLLALFRNLGWP